MEVFLKGLLISIVQNSNLRIKKIVQMNTNNIADILNKDSCFL